MAPSRGRLRRALVFVAVVVLVVAGTTAISLVGLPIAPDDDGPTAYPEYDPGELVPERAAGEGSPQVERADDPGTVLVDLAHGNRFQPEDVEPLLSAISATGARVEFVRRTDDFGAALSRADALLVVDPAFAYSDAEVDRVESFVEDGGRLVMLGEPTRTVIRGSGLSVSLAPARNRLDPLSTRFGIEFGSGYLYNMAENDGNFQNVFAEATGGGPLARGVDRTVVSTATAVRTTGGSPLLVATEGTRNVRGDALGEYPVAVVDGNVLAVGDTSFVQRANYNLLDNDRLIGNVASFLASGSRSRGLLDYPALVPSDPRVTYTAVDLLSPTQRLAADLRDAGREPTLSLHRSAGADEDTDVLVTTYEYVEEHDVGGGVTVEGGRVRVGDYESNTSGVVVIRAPSDGVDLLVVAEGPAGVRRAVDALTGEDLARYTLDDSTAVIRPP